MSQSAKSGCFFFCQDVINKMSLPFSTFSSIEESLSQIIAYLIYEYLLVSPSNLQWHFYGPCEVIGYVVKIRMKSWIRPPIDFIDLYDILRAGVFYTWKLDLDLDRFIKHIHR